MPLTLANLKRRTKVSLIAVGSRFLDILPDYYFPNIGKKPKGERHFCIFHISTLGSLGDTAMAYSIISQIREKDPQAKITLLIHRDQDRPHLEEFQVEIISLEGYFAILPKRDATKRIAQAINDCTDFIIPGADVLDGVYSPGGAFRRIYTGLMAQKSGARVHVIGFSFSHRAPETTRRLFRDRCQDFNIVCRDPLSAGRLSEVMGREIPSGADLAFLLPVGEICLHSAAQSAENMVAKWRSEGRPVVVFNANPLSFSNALPQSSRTQVVNALASALDVFAQESNAGILFLTHDNRKAHSDAAFLSEIIAALKTDFPRHFVPETVQPTDIKRLCSLSDLVVTGRMHLGIAGLGAGKTTMVTDYQGKVRGLYDLFKCPELALDLAEIIQKDRLKSLMMEALANRKVYEERISERLPSIKALSRKNLSAV